MQVQSKLMKPFQKPLLWVGVSSPLKLTTKKRSMLIAAGAINKRYGSFEEKGLDLLTSIIGRKVLAHELLSLTSLSYPTATENFPISRNCLTWI